MLTASPKTRRQLKERLEGKGFDPAIVEEVLSKMEEQGLVSDRTLAQAWTRSFLETKPSGRKRIAFELKKRGIQEEDIQTALVGYTLEEERVRAKEVAKRQAERWKGLERRLRQKRLYDFLVRRGFEFSLSRETVEAVEAEGKP